MKIRQLIEFTADVSQPLPELSAIISAVLATIPDVEQRAKLLRKLSDEIDAALHTLDDEEAAA